MKSNLSLSDVAIIEVPGKNGRYTVLKENDHLLRRFGQVDVFSLDSENEITIKRDEADEIWSVISGQAEFELEDQRKDSPSYGGGDIVILTGEAPEALLVPFGVACRISCKKEGILVRITTHQDDSFPADKIPNL